MPAHQPQAGTQEPQTRRDSVKSVEAYPYDPTLRIESQHGLDRLRCFADRALAADFFAIFQSLERNTEAEISARRKLDQKRAAELQRLHTLAKGAFNGELGSECQELAHHLLLDERGTRATDEHSLRKFAFAVRDLQRLKSANATGNARVSTERK